MNKSMDNTHIFRIENADGIGLYRVDGYVEWLFGNNDGKDESNIDCDHTDRRPTPPNDPIISVDNMIHPSYGFKNLKQLEDWVGSQAMNKISEHPKTNIDYRMAIYVYEGDKNDIIHGEKQSIMMKEHCKLVDVIQGHNISKYSKYGNSEKIL